jgi:hypothetical protein
MPNEDLSKLVALSDKKRIRWLEENTTPFLNILPFELAPENVLYEKIIDLPRWEFRFGLGATFTQRALKNKLSTLLGIKWSYCVNYDFQNAVWGFSYGKREIGLIIYFSKDGTTFQVEDRINPTEFLELVDVLHDKLFVTPLEPKKTKKKTSTKKKTTKRSKV